MVFAVNYFLNREIFLQLRYLEGRSGKNGMQRQSNFKVKAFMMHYDPKATLIFKQLLTLDRE